jgi:dinuclear metal center YbgI/SA1388 family protein
MKILKIFQYLEKLAPLSFQEDYDNCGLLVGDSDWELRKALLCLDITSEVMTEAVNQQCNLVISHHPLIFRGLKKLTNHQPETEIISCALKNDIAIYAIHTNLDNTIQGLNAHVLSRLGASDFTILSPKQDRLVKLVTFCPVEQAEKVRNALFESGAGHIGNYDCCSFSVSGQGTFRASEGANPFVGLKNQLHVENEIRIEVVFADYLKAGVLRSLLDSHPYEEVAYDIYPLKNDYAACGAGLKGRFSNPVESADFLQFLKSSLNLSMIRHTSIGVKPVSTIAICTGSGSFLIPEAIRSGVDVFLTADLKYHDFFIPVDKLLLVDVGHYESEHWVKEWLHDVLIDFFPNFAFLISEVNTNPIHYL